jgi:hypothetical protein
MSTNTTETQSVLSIIYEVSDYEPSDKSVNVTFIRESDEYIYTRNVNIPHNLDGTVEEEYFQEVLARQLLGVIHKYKIGLIEFRDPNDEPVGTLSI